MDLGLRLGPYNYFGSATFDEPENLQFNLALLVRPFMVCPIIKRHTLGMSIREFQVILKLGEGAYSSVYKVKRLVDNIEYALKRVKLGNLSDKEKQNALNEVRILASIRHPNIIGYKEAFLDEASNSLW